MSKPDSGYATEPWDNDRPQPSSNKPRFSHGNIIQKPRHLSLAQYPPQLHSYRGPQGTSDPALEESLPDLAHPSPFDDLYSQEPDSLPPDSATDSALAGLLGSDSGSLGVEPLELNSSAYDTMTPNTSVYPDPQLSASGFYSFLSNNEPWNVFDTVSFNDPNMSSSQPNYQPTMGGKRRRVHSDSGFETQLSSTPPRDSSPAATQHSVTKSRKTDKHFCELCKTSKSTGFSTSNDLARHKRGVHNMFEAGDKIWRCQVPGCTCADKLWPRRDNFSSHLKRMHFNNDENKVKEVIDNFQEIFDPAVHGRMEFMRPESSRGGRSKAAQPTSSPMAPPATTSFPSLHMQQQLYQPGQTAPQYFAPGHYTGSVPRQISRGPRTSIGSYGVRPNLNATQSSIQGNLGTVNPSLLTLPSSSGLPPRNMTRPSDALTAPPNTGTRSRQKRELAELDQAVDQHSHNGPSMADFHSIGQGLGEQSQFDTGFSSTRTSEHHTIHLDAGISQSKPGLEELKEFFAKLSPEARNEAKKLFRMSSPGTLAKFFSKAEQDDESAQAQNVRKRSVSKSPTKKKADDEKTLKCGYVIQQKGDRKGTLVDCNATFSSHSELRKHIKRHDKRFGCTFDRCYSKFGTKWEWKRHEHSQHIQNHAWRCRHAHNNDTCQELFHDEKEFRKHLAQHFGENSMGEIDREAKDCHLAKKWLGSFWCGYCQRIQKSSTEFGRKMDDERIDHIGGHILKGYKSTDWVELNGRGKTKGEMQEVEETGAQKLKVDPTSTASPSQSYRPEEAGEDEDDDEDENEGDDDEQRDTTSSSDTDSARPIEQPRSRPPLRVFTQPNTNRPTSYGEQAGAMSAPPMIQVHPPQDGSAMPNSILNNIHPRSMQQAQLYMMNDSRSYQQQQQQPRQNSQLFRPVPSVRRDCCECQGYAIYLDGLNTCCYCQHQFCTNCSYIPQPQEFSQNVFPSGMVQGMEGFDSFG